MMPIDVWNSETFDKALLAELNSERDLLCDYVLTDKKQFLEREAADGWVAPMSNPYADRQLHFVEHVIIPAMEQRTIRAWHYTRLTDDEVENLRSGGIYMSTLEYIRRRLNALVSKSMLSVKASDALYAASPFHQQNDLRAGKFWMASHPLPTDDSGVRPLLEHWGGESVYFYLKDPKLIEQVKKFGRARVVELAVPLATTRQAYCAAKAVVATFVHTLGCDLERSAFDLYTTSALGADAVLNIHTEGEPSFAVLGRG